MPDDPKPDPTPDPKPDPEPTPADKADVQAEVDKWKAQARKHEARAKENAKAAEKLKELEDAGKSETEKLTAAATEATKRAEAAEQKALRIEVAADKGLTSAQAKRLVGANREELEADADELLESFKPDTGDGPKPATRPRERLRGGGDPTEEPEETDPRKLAEKVPRAY